MSTHFRKCNTFSELKFEGPLSILTVFPQASVVKVVVFLIELQTKQVYFPHGSCLPVSSILVKDALTRSSLRLFPLRNPITGTFEKNFLCSLSGANNKWSSCSMFLMF